MVGAGLGVVEGPTAGGGVGSLPKSPPKDGAAGVGKSPPPVVVGDAFFAVSAAGFPNPVNGEEKIPVFVLGAGAGTVGGGVVLLGTVNGCFTAGAAVTGAEKTAGFGVGVVDNRGGVFGRGDTDPDLSSFGEGKGDGMNVFNP